MLMFYLCTGIGDLDDFGVITPPSNKLHTAPKTPSKESSDQPRSRTTPNKRVESLLQPGGKTKGLHANSPKKGNEKSKHQ